MESNLGLGFFYSTRFALRALLIIIRLTLIVALSVALRISLSAKAFPNAAPVRGLRLLAKARRFSFLALMRAFFFGADMFKKEGVLGGPFSPRNLRRNFSPTKFGRVGGNDTRVCAHVECPRSNERDAPAPKIQNVSFFE